MKKMRRLLEVDSILEAIGEGNDYEASAYAVERQPAVQVRWKTRCRASTIDDRPKAPNGVYDGLGGLEVSRFVNANLFPFIHSIMNSVDYLIGKSNGLSLPSLILTQNLHQLAYSFSFAKVKLKQFHLMLHF
ncbi:hypothetical protein E3N88_31680 [Mikania micrantha]|uniref:Uncharacterized protein n=1 Tax=Mikania micrantha TaxID=192012 RepID=A0A5N6M7F2_9ASTR|nr:hypothetical protein E3N88_31680 [Mikania micrantha]